MASTSSDSVESPSSHLSIEIPDLPKISAYMLKHGQPTPCWPSLLRPPIALQRGAVILNCFPSTTHFCLALDRKSTRLNSSHVKISYAVFCLKKKKKKQKKE